jgi:hypothetical protein
LRPSVVGVHDVRFLRNAIRPPLLDTMPMVMEAED